LGTHAAPASKLGEVQPVPADFFLGRERDIDDRYLHIERHRLVWLRGESGPGKSTFVREGLIPRLESSGRYRAAYVDLAAAEWDSGPVEGVARSLGLPASASADEVCRSLHATSPLEPVIFFDPADDYQAMHSEHFLNADGSMLSAPELCASNRFWDRMRRLLEERAIRCVFISRSDSLYGLGSLRLLPDPKDAVLRRLPPGTALSALERFVLAGSVSNAAHGWDEFARSLCAALEENGTLPVRMVLAFQALGYLAGQRIRPGRFHRLGGLPGLQALPLDHEI
jgi:hypothetical protein